MDDSVRDHGTNACYVWGPQDGPGEGCRCEPCRAANARAMRERTRRQAMEQFHPERALWVDAEPVRCHVRSLMASKKGGHDGVGLKRIAKVSGVSQGALWKLVYGKRRPDGSQVPSKKVHRDTATKLLAVTRADAADHAEIPAGPTWRLIEELIAWYNHEVGTPSGNGYGLHPVGGRAWLGRYLTGNPKAASLQLAKKTVLVRHARMIRELHDETSRAEESFRWRYCRCDHDEVAEARARHLDAEPFKAHIRDLRDQSGSLGTIAARLGVNRRTLTRFLEDGTTSIRESTADRWATLLGMHLAQFAAEEVA